MDAGFSGLGFNNAGGLSPSAKDYLDRLSGMRSVMMITADGMNEQVIESDGGVLFPLLSSGSESKDSWP